MAVPIARTAAAPLRAVALFTAALAVFAVMEVCVKLLAARYPVTEIAWARYSGHLIILVVVFAPRRRLALIRTDAVRVQVARSVLLLGVTLLNWLAIRVLPLAEVAAVVMITPLLVAALSVPMLRERIARDQWIAIWIGLAGVLILLRPGAALASWAAILPLGTAACFAVYQVLTRRISGTDPTSTTLFYTALVGTVIMSFTVALDWRMPLPWDALLMVSLGVLAAVGHLLFVSALEHASPAALAPYLYSQLVWATIFGFTIFGNAPDTPSLIGMAIIVASGLYVIARRRSIPGSWARSAGLRRPVSPNLAWASRRPLPPRRLHRT